MRSTLAALGACTALALGTTTTVAPANAAGTYDTATVAERGASKKKKFVEPNLGVLKSVKCGKSDTGRWEIFSRYKVTGGRYESYGSGYNGTPTKTTVVKDGRAIRVIAVIGTNADREGEKFAVAYQHLFGPIGGSVTKEKSHYDPDVWITVPKCNLKWHKTKREPAPTPVD